MTKYLAFLRGINVGGHKVIQMDDLRKMFVSMGLSNVKTYIQSGNVEFETPESNPTILKKKIEKHLYGSLGYKVDVILRTYKELIQIVKTNIFKDLIQDKELKLYVCFLEKKPVNEMKTPFFSDKKDLEIIKILGNDVYVVSHPVKGRHGFPNNFAEKELGVLSTARNWKTVCRIVDSASKYSDAG
jgi:uncharacterized protein (DUF1697 family)